MADADRPIIADPAAGPVDAPAEVADTARPHRRRLALMLSVPLIVAAVGGYLWITGGRYVSTDNAYVQQDMVSVSPDVSGRIVAVNVRENQPVKAGDLLFRIDPEPYRIALAEAEAELAEARVRVSTMRSDVQSAGIDIGGAREGVAFARQEYDRQAALMDRGFTTRASFQNAQHALTDAQTRLQAALSGASKAQSALGSGGGSGPAAVQTAMAKRDKAALNLARTEVRAPRDGLVSQTDRLQVGQITPSGVPALSIVAGSGAWIEANYQETDLDQMAVGQPVAIHLDAYPSLKVQGRVASIGAGTGSEFSLLPAQNANGNWVKVTQRVPVRIAIEGNPGRPMIAGLSADVTVDTRANGR